MQRISIIFRLLATWLLLSTMVDLSENLGHRLASLTSPTAAFDFPEAIQTRRTMMDRLATARVWSQTDRRLGEQLLIGIMQDAGDPEIRNRAAEILLELSVNDWPRGYRQGFLASILSASLQSAQQNKIPPSIILAQAIQESGWGRSQLAKHHHNLFGIKAGSHPSRVQFPTLEVSAKGVSVRHENFRHFASVSESIESHGRLLASDYRYENSRRHNQNWRSFLKELAPVYASDPKYAGRITQLIGQYKLDRWDGLIAPNQPAVRPNT